MEIKEYTLRDLLTIKNGKDYKHLDHGDVPVYGTGGIMTYVNEKLFSGESILLPRKGTLNNIIYVEGDLWTVDTMYWTIVDSTKTYPKYLYLYLSLLDLSSKDSGSTLPSMTFDSYYSIPVKLPGLRIQMQIADKIFTITNKILNNYNISKELESMAKTLYDYWFLQFEFPNEEGKPYKSSGGKMVWNAELKREIPEGWEVKNIKQHCNITWGQCPEGKNILPLEYNGDDAILYCSGAGDMRNGLLVDCQAKTNASRRYAHENDILMSVAGSIGALCIADKMISLGRAAVSITPKKGEELFIYQTVNVFLDRMKAVSSGSIQKVINDGHLNDVNFAYSIQTVNMFKQYSSILRTEILLNKENQELISLRDFLLPLLMNGQVTFK